MYERERCLWETNKDNEQILIGMQQTKKRKTKKFFTGLLSHFFETDVWKSRKHDNGCCHFVRRESVGDIINKTVLAAATAAAIAVLGLALYHGVRSTI